MDIYGIAVYGIAWKNLERKIAATRRQSLSKADLVKWRLEALEKAVDEYVHPPQPSRHRSPDDE